MRLSRFFSGLFLYAGLGLMILALFLVMAKPGASPVLLSSAQDAQGQVVENPCKVNRERTLQAMRDSGAIMGRPHKQAQVQEWRAAHPGGSKADCIRDTGLTKPTVYKWWAMAS
jgi:hypothetical protein